VLLTELSDINNDYSLNSNFYINRQFPAIVSNISKNIVRQKYDYSPLYLYRHNYDFLSAG